MLINARNILTILMGWFQHAYFLVLLTRSITPSVILSPYLPHHHSPRLPFPSATSPLPPPPPATGLAGAALDVKGQGTYFLFSFRLPV